MTTMRCPDCGHEASRVVETRTAGDGSYVRRRRECERCTFRFTTYERGEWDRLQVKKRDGSIEPFDREKLRAGVERATEKRPVSEEDVAQLLDAVEADLREQETQIVSSGLVGDRVAARLRTLDEVAYLRFVSVYEAFSDPEEFVEALEEVLDRELDAHRPGREGSTDAT